MTVVLWHDFTTGEERQGTEQEFVKYLYSQYNNPNISFKEYLASLGFDEEDIAHIETLEESIEIFTDKEFDEIINCKEFKELAEQRYEKLCSKLDEEEDIPEFEEYLASLGYSEEEISNW